MLPWIKTFRTQPSVIFPRVPLNERNLLIFLPFFFLSMLDYYLQKENENSSPDVYKNEAIGRIIGQGGGVMASDSTPFEAEDVTWQLGERSRRQKATAKKRPGDDEKTLFISHQSRRVRGGGRRRGRPIGDGMHGKCRILIKYRAISQRY